ncbi:GAP family protein [Enterococcus eurekensis]|uniref:GAP family protein n=2 Tax=Enterococcus TaxID=1350 RepID=A0ABV9M2I2_9ENTE|nr:GAP family protein [Candidatus Enterococcus avicola]
MWQVLLVTISTSAFDSLNPMAIGQQFVLQGLVKKPRDIWYFILTTGFVNFLGGVLFYFSLSDILIQLWNQIKTSVTPYLSIITLIGAVGLILYLIRYFWLIRRTKEEEVKVTIKGSVSPLALVLLGIGATISELATALPYFAFIGWLMNQSFSYWTVIGLMVIYNLIYMGPLMIMYVVYRTQEARFDQFYHWIQIKMIQWKKVLVPVILISVILFLFWQSWNQFTL